MKENADKHRALDTTELQKNYRESAEQMFRLRFQMSMGQMEGLKKYRSLRKERARMMTVLRERELHPESATAASAPAKAAPKKAESKKTAVKKAAAPKAKAPAAKAKVAAKPKAEKAPAKKAAKKTATKTSKG